MKKIIALLLVTLLLIAALPAALAENASVYDTLCALVRGRTFTLTVSTEAEGELKDLLAPYGTITGTLRQTDDTFVLKVTCEGEAYLTVTADAAAVTLDTNLLENTPVSFDWAVLEPVIELTDSKVQVEMTGPDHELIRFSCELDGESLENYDVEIQIGYITGPGNVHSLWDAVSSHGGESSREFYFTFSEEEYGLEGEGSETVETDADGRLTITREETYAVTHNEDDAGSLAVRAILSVQ